MAIKVNGANKADNTIDPHGNAEAPKKRGRKAKVTVVEDGVSEYKGTYTKFPGGMFRMLDTSTIKIAKSDNVGLFNVRIEIPLSWDGEPEEVYILHAPQATFLKKRTPKEISDMSLKGTRSALTATEMIKQFGKKLEEIIGKRRIKDDE